MPRRRILTARTAEVALEAAGRCRSACVQVVTEAPISGPAYQAAQQVLTAVKDHEKGAGKGRFLVRARTGPK